MSADSIARGREPHPDIASRRGLGAAIHPAWVRVTHWINALAMVVMIGSGWRIYNASPLFPFAFPYEITLGRGLAGALLWHFAAMWLLVVNGIVYVALGVLSGRFRRKLWPICRARSRPISLLRCAAGSRMRISWPTTQCRSSSIAA